MVVETGYYDALQVPPTADELQIKKAYRRLAVKLHPDKNPGDEDANQKFQAIGEAYQVLSDPQLRAAYDRYGKEKAKPSSGFEDPAEFFGMIFGGEAFADWIGEISLMKDLTKSMEMSEKHDKEGETQDGVSDPTSKAPSVETSQTDGQVPPQPSAAPPPANATVEPETTPTLSEKGSIPSTFSTATTTTADPNPYAQTRPAGLPTRPAIMSASEEDARLSAAGASQSEKDLRAREKKRGLTREQREELLAYERERALVREQRVSDLAARLVSRISVWTETDKGSDVTRAFRDKTALEAESLKMESFGLEILHAIGNTYLSKGGNYLKSQKFLGIGGFFGRIRDKGRMVGDVWSTISSAVEAQQSMEEMARAEERGGEAWTDEARAQAERRVTGKILAAAWRGSKFEIQSVLRDVCDKVIADKNIRSDKRVERAQALVLMGELLRDAKRSDEEETEYQVFENLMAEAAKKKEDKDDKARKSKKEAEGKEEKKHHLFGHGSKAGAETSEAMS